MGAVRTHLENAVEERTTGDTTLEFVHLGSGLVDVKGPNHNQLGCGRKVPHGDRDLGHDVFDEGVNVVPQLGRDRNDRSPIGHRSLDELEDLLVVFVGLLFADQIDLVLEDEDVLEFHNLDRGEVLGRLRLRAGFVRGDEEQRGVHHGGTVQHGCHQNVVTRAVDKRDVSVGGSRARQKSRGQNLSNLTRRQEKGGDKNPPEELHLATASRHLTRRLDLLVRAVRPVTSRTFTTRVLALVDLCADVGEQRIQNQFPSRDDS